MSAEEDQLDQTTQDREDAQSLFQYPTVGHFVDHVTVTQVNGEVKTEVFIVDKLITSDISQFKEAFFQLINRESEDIVRDARLNRITMIDPSEMPFLDDLKQEMTESLDEACQERNQGSNTNLFHKTYFTDEFDDFHLAARPTTDRYGSLIDCSRWEYAEPYEENTNTTIKRRYNPNYMLRANQRYRDSLRR